MLHADRVAQHEPRFSNLTLPGVGDALDEILAGATDQALDELALRVFAAVDAELRPRWALPLWAQPRAVSDDLVRRIVWTELVVQAACGASTARWLKREAMRGKPLGVCTGPVAVRANSRWALAPPGGIGCRRVFLQRGNRSAFPVWCGACQGQPAARAKASLARWADVHDRHGEQVEARRAGELDAIQEAWPRELWRLVGVHKRRQTRGS